MPRILAAVFIGLVAFAALLGAMMAFGSSPSDAADGPGHRPAGAGDDPARGPGGGGRASSTTRAPTSSSAPAGDASDVAVEGVDASWGPGPVLVLRLDLRNGGEADVEATSAGWTLRLQGERAAQGRYALGLVLPPGTSTVEVHVPFSGRLAADWWRDYAADGEQGKVAVEGSVAVRADGDAADVPFSWESAWDGVLAQSLAQAQDCDDSSAGVCLARTEAEWRGSTLGLRLTFQNHGDDAVRLRGDAGLALAGRTVASGDLDRTYLGAGGAVSLEVELRFSEDAVAAWWADHAAACESSPAALVLDLGGDDGIPRSWSLPVPDFATAIACGGNA